LVNLIMGQWVMGTDPWPTWPTQIYWPMTHWPIVSSVRNRISGTTATWRPISISIR